MHSKITLGLCALLLSGLSWQAQAAFKCWTNNEGVRECGNAIPPEYAQKRTETVDDHGRTIEVQERAKTAEELAAEKAEQERIAAEERKRAEEQARIDAEEAERKARQDHYDHVLLSTFSSEEDIETSRSRKVNAVRASINVTEIAISSVEQELTAERNRAADLERAGRPVGEDILKTIEAKKDEIEAKRAYIASEEQKLVELEVEYDGYIQRFRELREMGRVH